MVLPLTEIALIYLVEKHNNLITINCLEVCAKGTGYKGGGRHRKSRRQQTSTNKKLSARLKEILLAARERLWKCGRRGRGGVDREVTESEADERRDWSWDARMERGGAHTEK